jgi:hypothetical protein
MQVIKPKLKVITVDPFELLLDPNNPRYFSDNDDRIPESELHRDGIQAQARVNMQRYAIRELQDSMVANGYVPTDAIFVTLHPGSNKYLVREGNRRVTAIKGLLLDGEKPECPKKVKMQLERIEVLLVESEGDQGALDRQLSYLLGVRHHGSLKQWSPYARAKNAFKHYLDIAGQSADSFRWDDVFATQIAISLSVSKSEIMEGFRVYRAMEQINSNEHVKAAGGLRDDSYSLFKEMLAPRRKALRDYVKQDPVTFDLVEEGIFGKLDDLCHFTTPKRKDAPISSPQEWSPLNSILSDDDPEKRLANLDVIVTEKANPSVVWAKRSAELKRLDWARWLQKAKLILEPVNAGQMLQEEGTDEYDKAIAVLKEVDSTISKLSEQETPKY